MIWQIKKVREGEEQELLKKGWEPFGISVTHSSYIDEVSFSNKVLIPQTATTFIHLRKEVEQQDVEAFKNRVCSLALHCKILKEIIK